MLTGELIIKGTPAGTRFGSMASPTPLGVIEQITYLLLLRRPDDLHTLEENQAPWP
jgi:type I restriction enzyme M protein